MKKRSIFRFLKNKYFIIGLVIVVIMLGYYMTHRTSAPTFESTAATIGNVIEQVSVTGTISPVEKADLAFEKSGVIAKIYVKVGDRVNAGDAIASLDSAGDTAALASAQATLADISRSLTPTELAVETTALINADRAAYATAQGSLVNYADKFFDNPQSANPIINIRTQSVTKGYDLNNERLAVSDALRNWSLELNTTSADNIGTAASHALGYLSTTKSFIDDLSVTVNDLNPGNSGLIQTVINADVTAINSAVSSINASVDSLTTTQSNYNLKLAGNSSQSIAAQAAKVAQAKAQLDQDIVTSPIDGSITKADPHVGEFAAAGQSGFAVQNSGFKVEAYVPEADIAKVAVGNMASSTLDAYGSYVDFPAKVVMIDPAETVLEGVPTYKVTLQFVLPDTRIRSGMTANLEILTHEAMGVLEIPYRAITITSTSTTVRLVSHDGKSYKTVPVTTGLKGSNGAIEVTSGLNEGDKVVTYVTGQ